MSSSSLLNTQTPAKSASHPCNTEHLLRIILLESIALPGKIIDTNAVGKACWEHLKRLNQCRHGIIVADELSHAYAYTFSSKADLTFTKFCGCMVRDTSPRGWQETCRSQRLTSSLVRVLFHLCAGHYRGICTLKIISAGIAF